MPGGLTLDFAMHLVCNKTSQLEPRPKTELQISAMLVQEMYFKTNLLFPPLTNMLFLLIFGQNVRWPRRILPAGESR